MPRQEPVSPEAWLFSQALRYPFHILCVLLAAAVGAYALCAFVSAAGDFLDAARVSGGAAEASRHFAFRAVVFAALCAVSFLAGNAAGVFLATRMERDCLIRYSAGLSAQEIAFHLRRRTGELLPEAGGEALNRMFVPGFLGMFRAAFACLFLLVMTARIHIFLLPLPVIFTLFLFRCLAGFDWKNRTAAARAALRRFWEIRLEKH